MLDDIVAGVRLDMTARKARTSLDELMATVAGLPAARDPRPAFRAPELAVIAEVKRSSPAKGALADIPDPAALAEKYAAGGAAAISVLTEERRFKGSLADLVAVRAAVDLPILRKDFVVEEYQLWEGRAAGADLALLIVAALSDRQLTGLLELNSRLGVISLVEVHTADEARRAVDAGAEVIGINNRNLKTLAVDLAQFEKLVRLVPADRIKVAESGILSADDAARVASSGADAILVGEALVTGGRPQETVAALIAAGTAARLRR